MQKCSGYFHGSCIKSLAENEFANPSLDMNNFREQNSYQRVEQLIPGDCKGLRIIQVPINPSKETFMNTWYI